MKQWQSITAFGLTLFVASLGAVQPPGVVSRGVSTAYSTVAAAETVLGGGRSLNVVCSWGISGHPMSAF
jgi:hypothetical protein